MANVVAARLVPWEPVVPGIAYELDDGWRLGWSYQGRHLEPCPLVRSGPLHVDGPPKQINAPAAYSGLLTTHFVAGPRTKSLTVKRRTPLLLH